jgi:hypothetical protein
MEREELKTYSQARQDLFAWLCRGRSNTGTFVDLGAGHPSHGSNTRMLEERGWRGILADIATFDDLVKERSEDNEIFGDAFDPHLDVTLLEMAGKSAGVIDFLSLDLEPPMLTLQRLVTLPLDRVKFAVACVEHDLYRGNEHIRAAMRGIMESRGYLCVAHDVHMLAVSSTSGNMVPVEDWWVHHDLVNPRNAMQVARALIQGYEAECIEQIEFLERAKAQPTDLEEDVS